MSLRKADGPLAVHLPSAEEDRPSWSRVAVIAAIGFVVGVGWPRLAGVRMGPSVPATAAAPSASAEPAASGVAPVAPSAPVAAALAAPSEGVLPAAVHPSVGAPTAVTVGHGSLFACKTASGDTLKGTDCGTLSGLDEIVLPRLRRLSECPDAATASGKLRLVVHPDFARGALGVELARNPGVTAPDGLLACAKTDLAGASLAALAHENPRYSVSYGVTFAASGEPVAPASAGDAPAHATPDAAPGTAQVEWEVAIVRDAPRTGKVVARLQRGTALRVGPVKDGWYPVKYGDGFATDGWVYRGAIGK